MQMSDTPTLPDEAQEIETKRIPPRNEYRARGEGSLRKMKRLQDLLVSEHQGWCARDILDVVRVTQP
jgi:hypothetical protein